MKIIKNGQGAIYTPPGHDKKVVSTELFNPKNGCNKADIHITTFAAGTGMEEEVHPGSDHLFYLLKGRLEVKQNNSLTGVLETGDTVHIPAGEAHQIINTGGEEAVFIAVTVPPV